MSSLSKQYSIEQESEESEVLWGYYNKSSTAIWEYSNNDKKELEDAYKEFLTSDCKMQNQYAWLFHFSESRLDDSLT